MATKAPMTPTYHGAVPGSDNARISPVTAAEQSPRVTFLPRSVVKKASAKSAEIMQMSICWTA